MYNRIFIPSDPEYLAGDDNNNKNTELTSCVNREVVWALIPDPILLPVPNKPYGFCGGKAP